jgi:hypothetical protein|tara:strand:- start:11647 stop:11844 length:198 start_codon:yes stop_codon:yes gene_type:complete
MNHNKVVVNSSGRGDELYVLFENHTDTVISIHQYHSLADRTETITQSNGSYDTLLKMARVILNEN